MDMYFFFKYYIIYYHVLIYYHQPHVTSCICHV